MARAGELGGEIGGVGGGFCDIPLFSHGGGAS